MAGLNEVTAGCAMVAQRQVAVEVTSSCPNMLCSYTVTAPPHGAEKVVVWSKKRPPVPQ